MKESNSNKHSFNPKSVGFYPVSLLITLLILLLSFFQTVLPPYFLIIGLLILLLFPGYLLSLIILRRDSGLSIERLGLSIGLSITTVPLLVLYLNIIGITISSSTVLLTATFICGFSILFIYYREKIGKKHLSQSSRQSDTSRV